MYSDSNNLINKCAETLQGQFALNVRFLESVFQSQRNWINRTIDQQQVLNKAVLDSDDLSQVSENTQAYTGQMVESWLSDCQEAYKTLQQQGEEVSDLYRSPATALEKTNDISEATSAIVEEKVVKKSEPLAKTKRSVVKKAVAKKAVASTTKRKSMAKVAQKNVSPTVNETKSSDIKKPQVTPVKATESTVKASKTAPVSVKQTEGKVAVKKAVVKADKPAVIEKKVGSITTPVKPLQQKKPLTANNSAEKTPVNSTKE
jgi:hypothetical protein